MFILPPTILAIVLSEWIFGEKTWFLYAGLAIAFAALLCLSLNSEPLKRIGFVAYTGRISYGLYLLHVPVFDTVRDPRISNRLARFHSPVLNDLLLSACMVAAVYLAASVSWFCFESPILKLKKHFATRKSMDRPPLMVVGPPAKIAGR